MGKKKKITRRQALRRRRITKLIIFALVVGILYFLFSQIDIFRIKKIEVTGNKKVNSEEIVKKSMYKEGYNIYKFKKSKASESIKKIPHIETADIDIKLPNVVKIKVTESKPIAMFTYKDDLLLVDIEGKILEMRNRDQELKLAEVTGSEIKNPKEGENVFKGKYGEEEKEFIKTTYEKKHLNKMRYVNLTNMDSIVVELMGGEKVYFGNINDLEYKLDFLDKILKDTKKKNIKVKRIEFNKGDNPIVVTNEDVDLKEEAEKKEQED